MPEKQSFRNHRDDAVFCKMMPAAKYKYEKTFVSTCCYFTHQADAVLLIKFAAGMSAGITGIFSANWFLS